MSEKYGFVYIWFDRKHKRYYVGCHWGTENDGYICSSNWMRDAYRRRAEDFKRKILSRIYTNKKDLFEEEYRYLSMMNENELSKKYYNLHNKRVNVWLYKENHNIETKNKISQSNKGKILSEESRKQISDTLKKKVDNEFKDKMRQLNIGNKNRLGKVNTEDSKEKNRQAHLGKILTEEHKRKISENHARHNKGKPHSEIHKQRLKEAWIRRKAKLK